MHPVTGNAFIALYNRLATSPAEVMQHLSFNTLKEPHNHSRLPFWQQHSSVSGRFNAETLNLHTQRS